MRVLICGGRNYGRERDSVTGLHTAEAVAQRALVIRVINSLPESPVVIDGGAKGADHAGHEAATKRGLVTETFFANWGRHGRSAGVKRNQEMLDSGIDIVIAFKGGSGTADMRRRATRAGVPVWEPDLGDDPPVLLGESPV